MLEFIERLDDAIIDFADDHAASWQRRGLNLVFLRFVISVALMTLNFAITCQHPVMAAISLLIFGLVCYSYYTKWQRYRDYPEVARDVLALNAIALLHRD